MAPSDLHPLAIKARDMFLARYGEIPEVIVHAPGRINLIGEHTDYNDGFVLPAAIRQGVCFAVSKHPGSIHEWYAMDKDEVAEVPVSASFSEGKGWINYFLGACRFLLKDHSTRSAVRCVFTSDLPAGAGLSSSSALTSGFLLALNIVFELHKTREELAWTAHLVEHNFIGLKGGIMDQYACLLCTADHFLLLDCRARSYEQIRFDPPPEITLFLIDTHVKHTLTDSDYNTRAAECRRAFELLCGVIDIESLRDVSSEDIRTHAELLGPVLTQRLLFVMDENERVLNSVGAIADRNWVALGEYLHLSHAGLRDVYQVSCPELDFLANEARHYPDILGARMMGGGFGGCTLNLSTTPPDTRLKSEITANYRRRFGMECTFIEARPSEGARLLASAQY